MGKKNLVISEGEALEVPDGKIQHFLNVNLISRCEDCDFRNEEAYHPRNSVTLDDLRDFLTTELEVF
jgi:hypothetical protein